MCHMSSIFLFLVAKKIFKGQVDDIYKIYPSMSFSVSSNIIFSQLHKKENSIKKKTPF